MKKENTKGAHSHSSHHREELEPSEKCACFYCCEIFTPNKINKWVDEDTTALCPFFGIDSIIGDASGYPITIAFLDQMHKNWFT